MQTLGQLHNQLALIIGDPILPINISNQVINDGVRFSRIQREVYLQRALDEVLGMYIQQLIPLDARTRSQIATKLFPTTITTLQVSSTNNTNNSTVTHGEGVVAAINGANLRVALFITALYNGTTGNETTGLINYTTLPLPIHDAVTANALINSRSTQFPDPFFKQVTFQIGGLTTNQWVSDLYLYDFTNEIADSNQITLTYIDYPPILSTLAWNDVVKFEDMYMSQVYQKAALYAKIDSQEEDYQMQPQGQ